MDRDSQVSDKIMASNIYLIPPKSQGVKFCRYVPCLSHVMSEENEIRNIRQLVQSHTAFKGWIQNTNPGSRALETTCLIPVL